MSEVEVKPGGWVLFRTGSGYRPLEVEIRQAERVTPKLVRFVGDRWPRQCNRLAVVAAVDSEDAAKRIQDSIAGVSGEFERRRRAAEDERSRRITEARDAAEKQIARIVAGAA